MARIHWVEGSYCKVLIAASVALHVSCGATFLRSAAAEPHRASVPATSASCILREPTETNGQRRLALIVGVGQYKSEKVRDLAGPPEDARRFRDLLAGENGYGFPPENVCMLLDDAAGKKHVQEVFDAALVARARPQDVVVIFYAGHGSQTPDKNGDEPDTWDETFVLHDSRTDGVRDLSDDEFNEMLARLHAKTENVTVIIDSCNSGTAMRGDADTFVARYTPPEEDETRSASATDETSGDGGAGWLPVDLPGMVVFAAATDGTPALEAKGHGVFTDALLKVLYKADAAPITYAQAARRMRPLVAAESYQIPYFHGVLDKPVFASQGRSRPISWEVIELGPAIKLGGPPLAGVGKGAEFRIYDGAAPAADTRDPGKAKATVVVDNITGLNATAHVMAALHDAPRPAIGDFAILVRPADENVKIRVRLRPEKEGGGIPKERAAALREAIKSNSEANLLVDVTDEAGDFELSVGQGERLVLRGPENKIRTTYSNDRGVPENLWQHARQRALLQLEGEGGGDFADNETVQARLVPAPPAKQSPCARGSWVQAPPNSEQVIPLCHAWNVEVTVSKNAPKPLLVGGVVLSTDGGSMGFPADGRDVLLNPGETAIFDGPGERFLGTLPLDVQDRVLVFGTQKTNPVKWYLLTSKAVTRGEAGSPAKTGLYGALDRYLQPGVRGATPVIDQESVENTTWTLSSVPMRVEANDRFLETDVSAGESPITREYTIKNFDVRPYLPDDTSTALYHVLRKADWLARSSAEDGFSYKQHAWTEPTDALNLKQGVDCSRAIWFVFTRAGLPFNRDDRYLSTAEMVGTNTWMKDRFDDCSSDPSLRLGDVLVYRDAGRGDGHVVMVVDPDKRIAWGSHGWDGNARILPVQPDTGVEYQLIKFKKDWERWDRKTMGLKACWRYRGFAEEAQTTRGQPGISALAEACNSDSQCGKM